MKNSKGRKAITNSINVEDLKQWMLLDLNRNAGVKCQALISLKNNVSMTDICKVLGVSRESVRLWRKTIEIDGPEGFIKYHKTGRKTGLTEEIVNLLKSTIVENPSKQDYKQAVWDGKLICRFLKEQKGIKISVRTAQLWLNKIEFTRQRPRKKYRQTNDVEVEEFKKS